MKAEKRENKVNELQPLLLLLQSPSPFPQPVNFVHLSVSGFEIEYAVNSSWNDKSPLPEMMDFVTRGCANLKLLLIYTKNLISPLRATATSDELKANSLSESIPFYDSSRLELSD